MSDAAPTTSLIDVAATLRLLSCPVCGVTFAMPAELYLRRAADGGHIICPNGDTIIVAPDAPAELHLLNAFLLGELQAARFALDHATKKTNVAAHDAAEIRRREVRRRASNLALHSQRDGRYRICDVCQARIYFNTIDNHYEKQHADELLAMPAEQFES
ncbi:MAG: hypothetical protein QOF78_600 [Phycisphaerales bacterium]|nr:hypothetical protein [Phycisphaerales bacterium]